jgi:beta-fructofuranosidase
VGGNFKSDAVRDNYLDDFQMGGLLDEAFDLRILVRQHMVEVYINEQWIFSTSMFGTPEEAGGVGFWCGEGSLSVKDLQVNSLEDLQIPKIPKYVSKVPHYTYGTTLAEQEAQLKEDPFIKRFEVSREVLSDDPYRPAYHFVNPEGMLNDPNGLSFWQGKWHLFYQAFPPEGPGIHWGHAVSEDLIHWQDLPYAIYTSPGEQHACSGSIFIEDDRAIAMYLGHRVGIFAATSSDPLLLNWAKVSGKPVIPDPEPGVKRPYATFDPCIWKEGSTYYALISQGPMPKNQRMSANLFKSEDLETWEYMHPFVEGDLFTQAGDDNACPYFWPIGDKYIMPFFSHMTGGQYLLGDYDKTRQKFIASSHGRFNHGATYPAGVHAPSAFPDGKGGVITIFNLNQGGKPTKGWNQIMSLPMRLSLNESENAANELTIEPAGDIESLRYDHQRISNLTIPANEEMVLKGIKGNTMEIMVEIETDGEQMVEMNLLRAPDKREYTRILYQERVGINRSNAITLDASMSSIAGDVSIRPPETTSIHKEAGETLKLRIFIDKSSIEVFANGEKYLANRVYPSLEESVGISFVSRGKPCVIKSLDAWQMMSIWEE